MDDDGRLLVVIGGLPGSGKTTLLRRVLAGTPPGVVGRDSEQVAGALRAAGVRLPYGLLRPLVHLLHRGRVLLALLGPAPVVVLTDPWTGRGWPATVRAVARWSGRPLRLVLLDVPRRTAEDGQAARRRQVSARAMRRHGAGWARVLAAAGAPGAGPALVVDRDHADALTPAGLLGRGPAGLAGLAGLPAL
ncbi:AAA family ATPase [Geodermatophilus marinus]|uniref:AAA family ATPase n=1 Tax=Geodermatophilus sp. LHW52908 TaxID=2303986 RepID=UPI001313E10D|nr:AAA family ATPase [Geodermatophilus sp. LHW52908]